jgi:hypothetical protein
MHLYLLTYIGSIERFVVMRNCGCVLAKRVLEEIPDQTTCVNCSAPIETPEKDTITLNGSEEEVARLAEILKQEKAQQKSSSKSKSKSKKKSKKRTKELEAPAPKKQKTEGITNLVAAMVASSDTNKLMPKNANPEIYQSLFTSSAPETSETFCCRNAAHRLY